ncbi:MAG: hypothetical protein KF805_14955 [Phycisphaeraceae bacterium]|nr:hypothetical protein [Phycisphaeraceae bacterium]
MRDPLPNYWTVLKEATPLSRMVLVGGVLLVALLPLAIWKAGFSLLQMIDPKWLPKREELFLASGLALMCFVGLTGLVAPQIAIWMWTWKFGRPALARALLKRGFCAACKYEIGRVPLAKGGLTICPECGAAWKLNAPSSERESA